jgi:hypothetical protein
MAHLQFKLGLWSAMVRTRCVARAKLGNIRSPEGSDWAQRVTGVVLDASNRSRGPKPECHRRAVDR